MEDVEEGVLVAEVDGDPAVADAGGDAWLEFGVVPGLLMPSSRSADCAGRARFRWRLVGLLVVNRCPEGGDDGHEVGVGGFESGDH